MATTPPLRTSAQTPPTPLHGAKYDELRPRKSTRHTSSRVQRAIETPPPNPDNFQKDLPSVDRKKPSISRSAAHTYSPPPSTHTSPRKKIDRGRTPKHRANARTMDGAGSSSEGIDPIHNHDKNRFLHQPSLKASASMLPTPVKTPRKKPVQAAAVSTVARQLFPTIPVRPNSVEDAVPTPRKRRNKRHVGFSLYSSMEDEEDANSEGNIQIYTDSKEKVPELDPNEDNPFYEPPQQHAPPPEPSKGRSSRKRKAAPTAEDRKEIKDAFDRKEGIVYVFRGKKVFRKFPKEDDADEEDDSELETGNCRPLTRSSIKPRLLFPTAKQREEREAANIDDEEATTDVEELHDDVMTDREEEQVTTPVKQTVFSPATPPTTVHGTRSSTKKAPEAVDPIPYQGKKASPFNGWARTKAGTSTSAAGGKGKKRDAEAMGKLEVAGGHKKIKGSGPN